MVHFKFNAIVQICHSAEWDLVNGHASSLHSFFEEKFTRGNGFCCDVWCRCSAAMMMEVYELAEIQTR